MFDAFISYSREDRKFVEILVARMEEEDLRVWWDDRIALGSVFDDEIERAINLSKCVVVMWSPISVQSSWVREEAHVGQSRGVLVPISIAGAEPPLGFRRNQYLNLDGWTGSPEEERFRRLIQQIKANHSPGSGSTQKDPKPMSYAVDIEFFPVTIHYADAIVSDHCARLRLRNLRPLPMTVSRLQFAFKRNRNDAFPSISLEGYGRDEEIRYPLIIPEKSEFVFHCFSRHVARAIRSQTGDWDSTLYIRLEILPEPEKTLEFPELGGKLFQGRHEIKEL
jgi:hypothetical protein